MSYSKGVIRLNALLASMLSTLSVGAATEQVDVLLLDLKEKPLSERHQIEEVLVRGVRVDKTEASPLTIKLTKTAGSLGDPLRAIFSLPGITQTDDETSEPAVRGSGPQENEFIVDFLPTGYIFHIFGNSIFDENLLHDFGIETAGFGSDEGYATGAIFDVQLRDPRSQPIRPTIDLSFLEAGLLVEGEIASGHTFFASYRQSLIHYFVSEDDDEEGLTVNKQPVSEDFQFKYLWQPNDNHKVSWNVISAGDEAAETLGENSEEVLLDPGGVGKQSIDASFISSGLVWEWHSGPLSTKTGIGFLREQFKDRLGPKERQDVTIDQWTLRSEVTYASKHHITTLGTDVRKQKLDYDLRSRQQRCSDFNPECEFDFGPFITSRRSDNLTQSAFFIEDEWQLSDRWMLTSGLRLMSDQFLDEQFVEPRIRIDFLQDDDRNFHASLGRYHQQPKAEELIAVFGNPKLGSPKAQHLVFGVAQSFSNSWSMEIETYYKKFDKLVLESASNDPRNYINGATGRAYGLELMLTKEKTDRWYGWVSASWSKTERSIDSTGVTSPYFTDAPFVFNIVGNYQLTPKWNAGLRWNYRSGLPYTPIVGNRPNPDFTGRFLPTYGALNSKRASAYHRLDLRVERSFDWNWSSGRLYFDIINAYNRENFQSVEYQPLAANSDKFELIQEAGLGTFPSIGIKLNF